MLAQRLRRSPHVRPLVTGRDPIGTIRDLAARRERFYAAATIHQSGVAEVGGVVDAIERRLSGLVGATGDGTVLLRATTPIGRIVLGEGILVDALAAELAQLRCAARGRSSANRVPGRPSANERPRGSASVASRSSRSCSRRARPPSGWLSSRRRPASSPPLRVERAEPLVAIGGGALGDTAGFLAATYLRGVRFIQVPTTLVAQIDSAIGGKTGVDLPEGKNLVGAFHQPAAIVIDVSVLRTLPARQLRAALGEAVKMAVLGDERLFALLETDGEAIAAGDPGPFAFWRRRRDGRARRLGQG